MARQDVRLPATDDVAESNLRLVQCSGNQSVLRGGGGRHGSGVHAAAQCKLRFDLYGF